MRYFAFLDFQHMVLAFFIGMITVILVGIAWWRYPPPDEEQQPDLVHTLHAEKTRTIPPILIFIILGSLLGALGYLLVVGILGNAIS